MVTGNTRLTQPSLASSCTLAAVAVGIAAFGSCGNSSSAAGATLGKAATPLQAPKLDPEEQARIEQERARTRALERLKGRWKLSLLEDVVFEDDGLMFVDGPGALDATCGYQVLSSNRAKLRLPYATEFVAYDMHFIEDKVRFSVPDGLLKGDGLTLTRK